MFTYGFSSHYKYLGRPIENMIWDCLRFAEFTDVGTWKEWNITIIIKMPI